MRGLEVLHTDPSARWGELLARPAQHDVFHTAAYHALEQHREEGVACLFAYREEPYSVLLPLVLRPIERAAGLETVGRGWVDATSVYGYAGPLASHADVPAEVRLNFQRDLTEALRDLRVVSAFSRLHPLIPHAEVLDGLGECQPAGQTLSIDLTLPPAAQQRQYRPTHRHEINRLRRLGATCVIDPEKAYLDEFIDIYYETMRRVHAAPLYFFEPSYFRGLAGGASGMDVRLFVVRFEGRAVSASLVTVCDGIAQYFLAGTRDEFTRLAPMKLLIDTVRGWAAGQGLRVLHLGGGVSAREDSLFHFKAGFTSRRHDFATWRCVLLPEVYRRLAEERERRDDRLGPRAIPVDFFPRYRRPPVP